MSRIDVGARTAAAFARALGYPAMIPCTFKQPRVKKFEHLFDVPQHPQEVRSQLLRSGEDPSINAWAMVVGSVVRHERSERPVPRIVVLDLDTSEPSEVDAMLRLYGRSPLTVRTPSRGSHHYFVEPDEAPVVGSHGFKGQPYDHDVKARRSICHLPGSLHEHAPGRYAAFLDGAPLDADALLAMPEGALLAQLPTFAVAALDAVRRRYKPEDPEPPSGGPPRFASTELEVENLWRYMAKVPPAVEGEHGHDRTRGFLCKIGDLGASEELALELAREWDDTNEPRWGETKIRAKVADAYRTRHFRIGWRLDPDAARAESEDEPISDEMRRALREYFARTAGETA